MEEKNSYTPIFPSIYIPFNRWMNVRLILLFVNNIYRRASHGYIVEAGAKNFINLSSI